VTTDVYRLESKLGIDLMESLRRINRRTLPTKAVVAGLARELDFDVSYGLWIQNALRPLPNIGALCVTRGT
jgi:hypothetical protein